MEVNINTLSEVEYEAEILVTNEELQPHFEKAYERYRPKAEVRGFRKGKVPIAMVKKLYGEAIEQESLDTVASEFYRAAMTERNIRPIGQPAMTDLDFKRGDHFRFKIKYEVKPEIELGTYKGLAVERPIHKVTEDEIQKEIEHIRRINSTTEEAATVTGNEYIVTGTVQELDAAGTPLIGKKTPDARFYLADETLAPVIREALAHAEVHGVYRATLESQHGDHSHTSHIAITVTKIEKVNLPAFDDAFIKKITSEKMTSTDEFLKNLRADLVRYWEEKADRAVSDAIARQLVGQHNFPVPESLVNTFLDAFVEDVKNQSKDKKLPPGFDEQKFRTESREHAAWQARWMLLKDRIAEKEEITVSDEELDARATDEAARIGIDKERLLEYYKNSGSVIERMRSDKIMAFLKHNAIITEREVAHDQESR